MARNPSPESSKTDPKEDGRSFVQVEWGKFVEDEKRKKNEQKPFLRHKKENF